MISVEYICKQGRNEILEASTRIELVYTDLQSVASPLRQLAIKCGTLGYNNELIVVQD